MNKKELPGQSFWAKKSDNVVHIVKKGESAVHCGKYGALLGNNYAPYITEVCPDCLAAKSRK